jgi:hypothetical protein
MTAGTVTAARAGASQALVAGQRAAADAQARAGEEKAARLGEALDALRAEHQRLVLPCALRPPARPRVS